ncbi:MAG: putative molybdenum carrier protein [Candidatus Hydrogenedentes bacterium]|nr:putative molybdenum carrier protein [Candidatus Hydrogenedentota bacterium]
MTLAKVVSGGQTGVDRAALDAAMRYDLPVGGWCPKGRLAEDGPISPAYPLEETPTAVYQERTLWNVRDSDGTLILTSGEPVGGTALTIAFARQEHKPHLVIDLAKDPRIAPVQNWLRAHNIRVLNVAGPRESTVPGIYAMARQFLEALILAELDGP